MKRALIDRAAAVALIRKQLDRETLSCRTQWDVSEHVHYGKFQLEELMTAIYGPPKAPEEIVTRGEIKLGEHPHYEPKHP